MDILIPVLSVLLSGIVAVVVARIQVKSALNKLKLEYKQKATEQLFLKRLDIYPKLHSELLALTKKQWVDGLESRDVTDLIYKLDQWEIDNAIFVSPLGLSKIKNARITFGNINNKISDSEILSKNKTKQIMNEVYSLSMLLKTELGILEADDFHNPTRTRKWNDVLKVKHNDG
jgi:hypothetical protein